VHLYQGIIELVLLYDVVGQQCFSLSLGKKCDVMNAYNLKSLDLATFNHPSVANKSHLFETKPTFGFLNLGS
jgi:hypothetical protein